MLDLARQLDERVRANPSDNDARTRRDQARARALTAMLDRAAALRASAHPDAALVETARALKQRDEWGATLDATLEARLRAELQAERDRVRRHVKPLLDGKQALAAEAALARLRPLLARAELAKIGDDRAAEIAGVGVARCAELQSAARDDQPYWMFAVGRYCRHFGESVPNPALPVQNARVQVKAAIEGLRADELDTFAACFDEALRQTPWHAEIADRSARVEVTGKYEVTTQARTVTLHAPYRAKARGTSISGPIFGSGSTRVGVTRVEYDDQYAYDAEEHRTRYELSATVHLQVAPDAEFSFRLKRAQEMKGYEHDVTFEPANVRPERPTFPGRGVWLGEYLRRLNTKLAWRLNRLWIDSFCRAKDYSVDEAARCLVSGQTPFGAVHALAVAVGEDAPHLAPLIAVRTAASAMPPKKREAPPPGKRSETPEPEDLDLD